MNKQNNDGLRMNYSGYSAYCINTNEKLKVHVVKLYDYELIQMFTYYFIH